MPSSPLDKCLPEPATVIGHCLPSGRDTMKVSRSFDLHFKWQGVEESGPKDRGDSVTDDLEYPIRGIELTTLLASEPAYNASIFSDFEQVDVGRLTAP